MFVDEWFQCVLLYDSDIEDFVWIELKILDLIELVEEQGEMMVVMFEVILLRLRGFFEKDYIVY